MSFKIGDKLMCVKGFKKISRNGKYPAPENMPEKGKVYIYDGVNPQGFIHLFGFNLMSPCGHRIGFDPLSFRKLDDDFGAKVCEEIEKTFIKIPVEHEPSVLAE